MPGDTEPRDTEVNKYLSFLLSYFLFNFFYVQNGSDGNPVAYSLIYKRTTTANKAAGA